MANGKKESNTPDEIRNEEISTRLKSIEMSLNSRGIAAPKGPDRDKLEKEKAELLAELNELKTADGEPERFDIDEEITAAEKRIDDKLDTFKTEGELTDDQDEAATPPEKTGLTDINKEAVATGGKTKKEIENIEPGEELITPETEKFFSELKLEDFKDLKKLREKFDGVFTDELLENLNTEPDFKNEITNRYFDDLCQKTEEYFQIALADQEKDKKFKGLKQEGKKFLKSMWGGGLYAAANRAVMTGAKALTTVGLPLKILAGGVTGAAVGGINYALGRGHEALTGKGIKKLASKIEKSKNSGEIEKDVLAKLGDDLSLLMNFERNKFEHLDAQENLLKNLTEKKQINIFGNELVGEEEGKKQAMEKRNDLVHLTKLSAGAKYVTGKEQKEAIKERQTLIKKLIDNNGLNEFITLQIEEQIKELKNDKELDPATETKLIKQAHLMVERDINSLLGDVVAQEKFDEIDKKGKSAFEKSYLAKLVGKAPAESFFQAVSKGFVSGSVAGLAYTDAMAGGIYMAMQRMQGTLKAEILKRGETAVKMPAEIIKDLKDLYDTDVGKVNESEAKNKIIEARARVKLPDIKEVDRVKIEKTINILENRLIKNTTLTEASEDNNLTISEMAEGIITTKGKEVEMAADLAETEKKRKSLVGLAKQFFKLGYTKVEGEGKSAILKQMLKLGWGEKGKILLKTGWEGAKGGAAGAIGAEFANMGGAAASGEDIDISSSLDRAASRITVGLSDALSKGEAQPADTTEAEAKPEAPGEEIYTVPPPPDITETMSPQALKELGQSIHLGDNEAVNKLIEQEKIPADSIRAVQDLVEAEKDLGVNTFDQGLSSEELKTVTKELFTDNSEKAKALLDTWQQRGLISSEQNFNLNHALLEHAGFQTEKGPDNKFNLTIELGQQGAPEHLEQVFYRMGIDNTDLGQEIDNVKAARILNIGANLRVLSEGNNVAGIAAEDFKNYASFEDGKLEIKDYESFKDNVLDKLTEHAEEIITPDNIDKTGVLPYADNIIKETWEDMANSEITPQVEINLDQEAIDRAEHRAFQGTLAKSGIAEFATDLDPVDEDTATFTSFGEKISVQDNKVVSIGETKLDEPITLGSEKGGDQLLDEIAKVRSEALLSKYEEAMKPRHTVAEIKLPEVSEYQVDTHLRQTVDKLGFGKGQGAEEWQFLKNKSIDDLLNKDIEGHAGQHHDWLENHHRGNLREFIQKEINDGKLLPPKAGGPIKIGDALHELAASQTKEQLIHDLKVAEKITQAKETAPPTDIAEEKSSYMERIDGLVEKGDLVELKNIGLNPDINVYCSPEAQDILEKYGRQGIEFADKGISILGGSEVVTIPNQEVDKLVIGKTASGDLTFTAIDAEGNRSSEWSFAIKIDEADKRWETAEAITKDEAKVETPPPEPKPDVETKTSPAPEIKPETQLNRIGADNGKISAQFSYDKNGEVVKYQTSGMLFGFNPEEMLNEDYKKTIEDVWSQGNKELKQQDMINDVNQTAQAIELNRRLLAELESNSQGQTPEAKFLREAMDHSVDKIEKRYGDVFKENLEATPPAPEAKPDTETEKLTQQLTQTATAEAHFENLKELDPKVPKIDISDQNISKLNQQELNETQKVIDDQIKGLREARPIATEEAQKRIDTVVAGYEDKLKIIDTRLEEFEKTAAPTPPKPDIEPPEIKKDTTPRETTTEETKHPWEQYAKPPWADTETEEPEKATPEKPKATPVSEQVSEIKTEPPPPPPEQKSNTAQTEPPKPEIETAPTPEERIEVGEISPESEDSLRVLADDIKELPSSAELKPEETQIIISDLKQRIATGELKIPESSYLVYVNKNPDAQFATLLHYDQTNDKFTIVGTDSVSTANAERYPGSETPSGTHYVQKIVDAKDWGDPYGQAGHEVYDLSEGIGIAFHATDEPERLGKPASHGCIRMSNEFNDLLDKHKVLDVNSPVIVSEFDRKEVTEKTS